MVKKSFFPFAVSELRHLIAKPYKIKRPACHLTNDTSTDRLLRCITSSESEFYLQFQGFNSFISSH